MNTLNYENQTITQRPVTLPVEDTLSPQEEAQAREEKLNTTISLNEELQAQADEQRQLLVSSLAHQSKQTQVEIYLAVALEKDADLYNNNALMLESLEKTQEQNNAVKAYAAYQESNTIIPARF